MNISQFLSTFIRPVRFLVTIAACLLMFLGQVAPAAALGSTPTDPRDQKVHLDEIYSKAEDALRTVPRMEDVQREAGEGLNEVQGAADVDNLSRPSNSQQATSIVDKVEKALENVTNKKENSMGDRK